MLFEMRGLVSVISGQAQSTRQRREGDAEQTVKKFTKI